MVINFQVQWALQISYFLSKSISAKSEPAWKILKCLFLDLILINRNMFQVMFYANWLWYKTQCHILMEYRHILMILYLIQMNESLFLLSLCTFDCTRLCISGTLSMHLWVSYHLYWKTTYFGRSSEYFWNFRKSVPG